jgi:energy-converting hydrogenase Eha subunit A
MRQKDIAVLVGVGVLAAIVSSIIASKVFTTPANRSTKVPVVTPISGTFPDVKNDSQYNTIFNSNAIDPTQLIKIGPNQNPQPFSNSQ